MNLPRSLVRRIISAAERGGQYARVRGEEGDRVALRDAQTIENALAALKREIKSQQRPVGRNAGQP